MTLIQSYDSRRTSLYSLRTSNRESLSMFDNKSMHTMVPRGPSA